MRTRTNRSNDNLSHPTPVAQATRARCLRAALALSAVLLIAGAAHAQFGPAMKVEGKASFKPVPAGKEVVLALVLDVPDNHYIQGFDSPLDPSTRLAVTVKAPPQATVGQIQYPPSTTKTVDGISQTIYKHKQVVYVPLMIAADAKAGPLNIEGRIGFQMCQEKPNNCFAPNETEFKAVLEIGAGDMAGQPQTPELFKDYKPKATTQPTSTQPATTQSTSTQVPSIPGITRTPTTEKPATRSVVRKSGAPGGKKESWNAPTIIGIAFISGILFNIVPCVLPVLPLKVMGFVEVAQHDRRKTVLLATTFGLGIVVVFGVLSIFVVVLQTLSWGQQFSNPWFRWPVVGLLLVMSLWMFGILDFNLPTSAYNFSPRHDTYFGNFLWGILTAMLSTPCTGPYFVGAIGAASQLSTALGVFAMLMVGVGMAVPYIVLSAFPEAARRFPRVGPWSELFKQMMGFILLGFTVFFAAAAFESPAIQWWATVPIALLAALFMVGRTVQLSKEPRAVAISSIIAVTLLTLAILVALRFTGLLEGRQTSTPPAEQATGSAATQAGNNGAATQPANNAARSGIDWIHYTPKAFEEARATNRIVLVKFTAGWCLTCQLVEANVYHDSTAIEELKKRNVVTIKADLTERDALGWSHLRKLTPTGGIPYTAIYSPEYDDPITLDSVYTTSTLLKTLDSVK